MIVSDEEAEEETTKKSIMASSEILEISRESGLTPASLNADTSNVETQIHDNNILILEKDQEDVSQFVTSSTVNIDASCATDTNEKHVSKQTVEKEDCTHIKLSTKMHSTKESENTAVEKTYTKFVADKHVSQQSDGDANHRTLFKINEERHASKESKQPEEDFVRKKRGDAHMSQQTESTEWKVKKQSFFGHVSQLSNLDYEIVVPHLKRSNVMFASKESVQEDIRKPMIKISEKMYSTKESAQTSEDHIVKPHIKMSQTRSSTMESVPVDLDAITRKRFLQRNVHGHSSQSTVQKLLYGEKGENKGKPVAEGEKNDIKVCSIFLYLFKIMYD